jgi:hypothetical protein
VPAVANSLPVNTYNAQVTIAFQGSSTAPLVYNVTLNVIQAQTLTVTPTGALNFAFQIGGAVPAAQKTHDYQQRRIGEFHGGNHHANRRGLAEIGHHHQQYTSGCEHLN